MLSPLAPAAVVIAAVAVGPLAVGRPLGQRVAGGEAKTKTITISGQARKPRCSSATQDFSALQLPDDMRT